jgi:hypothetical protein
VIDTVNSSLFLPQLTISSITVPCQQQLYCLELASALSLSFSIFPALVSDEVIQEDGGCDYERSCTGQKHQFLKYNNNNNIKIKHSSGE